jgi:hypothetical protein
LRRWAGKTGQAGAAEHDRLGAVFGESAPDLPFDAAPHAEVRIFERQH